uniref:Reverse transcriptase domain-containing protein n=1 Tax=Panagrolaimus superbus TaxID=310955 RepID=A0A914YE45_9BILA
MNQKVVGVKYISDRIIQVLLKLRAGKTLRITQVYAPQSGLGNDEYDAFLDQLSSSLARPVTNDVVLGDFNASTGPRRYGEQYIGKYSWDSRSNTGTLLCQFCLSHQLYLMNGFFKKGRNRRWTWHSPNRTLLKEIDHVLSNKKSIVTDVTVLSKASGSDHRMVRATIKLCLKINRSRPYNHIKPEYDRLELIFTMIEQLRHLPIAESPIEELNQLKRALSSTAKCCARQPTLLTRLSPLSLSLMERRRLMKHGLTDGRFALIEYAELCKLLRKSIKNDLNNYYVNVMEKAIEENRLKRGRSEVIQKQNQMVHLERPDGTITDSAAELMEVTARFYNDLYSSEAGTPIHVRDPYIRINRINADELIAAGKRMKANTAPGADKIPSKAVKSTISTYAGRLADAFYGLLEENNMPPELLHAKTILLYKKGNRLDIGNYRPISLLPVLYKLLTRVIADRVQTAAENANALPPEQAGFRRTYSTVDHIHSLNQLLEKSREFNRMPLYLVFIDFKKAFDSIELQSIWDALEKYGIDAGDISSN